MRVFHPALLTAAAMLCVSFASAQGLGDIAAREREKRKAAPAKPVKVYTDQEIASGPPTSPVDVEPQAGAESGEAVPATDAQPDAGLGSGGVVGGETAMPESGEPTPEEKAAAEEAEARAKAEADWRERLRAERDAEGQYQQRIDQLNAELGDLSTMAYGAGRARKMELLEESKRKLAETQANIARLEDEGRRNRYR